MSVPHSQILYITISKENIVQNQMLWKFQEIISNSGAKSFENIVWLRLLDIRIKKSLPSFVKGFMLDLFTCININLKGIIIFAGSGESEAYFRLNYYVNLINMNFSRGRNPPYPSTPEQKNPRMVLGEKVYLNLNFTRGELGRISLSMFDIYHISKICLN